MLRLFKNKSSFLIGVWLCVAFSAAAQPFSGGFNFNLPEFDTTTQRFLPRFSVVSITQAERVTVQGSNFMVKGQPIRFWGVNITAGGCFPPKNRAAEIAGRLRKMGVNLVRFHHLENTWSGDDGSIFLYRNGTRQLNPQTLDRLDFFIAQLRQQGIYVNMNLNVSREFRPADGVAGTDSMPDFAKGITLFDPQLQTLQKEYAQQLLGHINPYTNLPLAKDPVLAMVEMNNENTLYGFWKEGRLRLYVQGGALMRRHVAMLDERWTAWLRSKYNTQADLERAWNVGLVAPGQGELLRNRGFEESLGNIPAPWALEVFEGANAAVTSVPLSPFEGSRCAQLQVNRVSGTDWHIQFKQSAFSVRKDSSYTLRFAVRASGNLAFSVTAMRDNPPYTWYDGATFRASTQWQIITFTFRANENNNGNARISISPMQSTGTFWFDAFSVAPPSVAGVLANEQLAAGTVGRINWGDRLSFSTPRVTDQAEFYVQVQKAHFDDKSAYLKSEVGVLAPITGTNALVGLADAAHQEDLDYLDDHAYWDHPDFPGQAWDPNNWRISNQSILRDARLHALTSALSGLQFTNKPFTVSEYNHGAPNRYRVEMPPVLAAYSAFQGTDGVMFFEYNGDNVWEPDVLDNFFSLNRDNSVMALFPSCALAYRNGMIRPDPNPLTVQYSKADMHNFVKQDPEGRWGRFTPYDRTLVLTNGIQTNSYRATSTTGLSAMPQPGRSPFTTATGETTADTQKGILTTGTPGYCAISGFLNEAPGTIAGGMTLVRAAEFGTITWVSTTGDALADTERGLLTIATRQQNTNMLWRADNLTVGNRWGNAPTLQQAQTATLRLRINAARIRLYPLNAIGQAGVFREILPVEPNVFEVNIDQNQDRTLWYGIEAVSRLISTKTPELAPAFKLSPNPLRKGQDMMLNWSELPSGPVLFEWMDMQGRSLRRWAVQPEKQQSIPAADLPSGTYMLRVEVKGKMPQAVKVVVQR
jgi:Carbohydrate binding domain